MFTTKVTVKYETLVLSIVN